MAVKNRKKKGKGVIDQLGNIALSDKHKRLLPGEKHQVIYPAVYCGPGTN